MTKRNAKAVLVDSLHDEVVKGKPGHFKPWREAGVEGIAGLHFWCPCGCGALLGVSFVPPRGWTWNGDLQRPTVQPSILHSSPGGCGWHGYLTAGEFVEC